MEKDIDIKEQATFYLVEPEEMEKVGSGCTEREWVDYATVEEYGLDYCAADFDEDIYKELMDDVLDDYPHYVVKAEGCTWDKKTGYKLCNSKYDVLERDYDVYQYLQDNIGKKVLKIKESCHDVPTGYPVTIIGLTESEFAFGNLDAIIRNIKNILTKCERA